MLEQQIKIRELFDNQGWELLETWIPEDRFIAETWIIKSTWSPTDCLAAINYVVDPQWTDGNKKHLGVRSVALSLTQSHYTQNGLQIDADSKFEFHDEKFIRIYIKPNLEKHIPEIFEKLSTLRQKFDNFKQ